jgi:hypothetical protein
MCVEVIARGTATLRPEGPSYIQNNEKQCVSAVLIWPQATLLSVSMMSIPSAQNSPRFCRDVRFMTLSSIIGIPRLREAPERLLRSVPAE